MRSSELASEHRPIERPKPHLMRQLATVISIAGLLVATAAFRSTQNMAQTTLPLLGKQRLGLGASDIGVLGAAGALLGAGATVGIARRIPWRLSALEAAVGSAITIAAVVLFWFSGHLALFIIATLLLAFSGGIAMPGLAAAFGTTRAMHRERALGLYTLTLSASLALGPVVEGVVLALSHQNLREPFLVFIPVAGLGTIAVVPYALRCWREHQDASRAQMAETSGAFGVGDTGQLPAAVVDQPITEGTRQHRRGGKLGRIKARLRSDPLFGTKPGRLALNGQLLYSMPFSAVVVFGGLAEHDLYHVNPSVTEAAFTTFFLTSFLTRLVITWKAPLAHKGAWLAASAVLTIIGVFVFGAGNAEWELFAAMAILGVPHGLTFPTSLALLAESAPPEELPKANSSLFATTSITNVTAPAILGAIADTLGYRAMLLLVLVPVAVFGGALISQLWPSEPQKLDSRLNSAT